MEKYLEQARERAIQCIRVEASSLGKQIEELQSSDSFLRAVQMIDTCAGKVIFTGIGKSGLCGAKIAASFSSIGIPSFFLDPIGAYHGQLGVISNQDLLVFISYSGQTEELLRLAGHVTARVPVICVCGYTDSPLATMSDCVLKIRVDSEADPLRIIPTSSVITTLAIGDALTSALMNIRGISLPDVLANHPGGSIGSAIASGLGDIG